MTILYAILLCLANGMLLLTLVVGLPGTWLMAGLTALVAWLQWDPARSWTDQMISGPTLLVVFGLAILGELVEFFAGAAGAKRAGASGWGTLGAILGAFVGGVLATFFIPIPVIGSLMGACLGAAAGAASFELGTGRRAEEAYRSGVGAGIGRFQGTIAKLGVGVGMWLVVAVAAFWP